MYMKKEKNLPEFVALGLHGGKNESQRIWIRHADN